MSYVNDDGIDLEIARMFYQENQEKKNIGRNIYYRAATRKGRLNKINYPSDFLSKKDRREYKKPGKVEVHNMYDDIKSIPKYEEIDKMDVTSGRNLIETLKTKHSVKALCKQWGMTNYTFYHSVVPKFEIPLLPRAQQTPSNKKGKNNNKNTKQVRDSVNNEVAVTSNVIPMPEQQKEYIAVPIQEPEFEGFQIKFAGRYSGEKLSDRVMSYITTLEKERNYKIKLVIEEEAQ